jgi:hypothetical protein
MGVIQHQWARVECWAFSYACLGCVHHSAKNSKFVQDFNKLQFVKIWWTSNMNCPHILTEWLIKLSLEQRLF